MNIKNREGITLIALVVTIIILLILAGVSLVIFNSGILNKAVMASNVTVEAMLKEKIEIAQADAETSYLIDKLKNSQIDKTQYIKEKIEENIKNSENVNNVTVTNDSNGNYNISLCSNNNDYKFCILENKEVKILANLKIGDYIEYPIEYDDIYSGEHYTKQNGWRVIDDGSETGIIKIISTGIPTKWEYKIGMYETNNQVVDNLINNFENMNFLNDSSENDNILGNYFKKENISEKVTTITLSDLNHAYNVLNNTARPSDDVTQLENVDDLFINDIEKYYWLATSDKNTDEIYYINEGFIDSFVIDGFRIGIRPVIYLKNNLSFAKESEIWKIIN